MCVFSIDQMSEIVRYGIETGIKLKEELVLEQEDFIVSPVCIVAWYIWVPFLVPMDMCFSTHFYFIFSLKILTYIRKNSQTKMFGFLT